MLMTSPLPYFLLSAGFLLLAMSVVRFSPFYANMVRDTNVRYLPLDGLRGFLALGVFFHHAVIFYFFYLTGKWQVPPSAFYTLLGQIAVSLFFMITGFLFWLKAIQTCGKVNPIKLLQSRLRRLVPMYVVSVMLVFCVAFVAGNFVLRSSYLDLSAQMLHWMSFGFLDLPDVNGLNKSWIINSVYWTLRYEWLFYGLLPLIAWAYRDVAFVLLALVAAVLVLALHQHIVLLSFIFGAVSAWLSSKNMVWLTRFAQSRLASVGVFFILVLMFWRLDTAYTLRAAVMLFVTFYIFTAGNSLFGLLVSAPARLLGATSYSLYLLHSPILFLTLFLVNRNVPITSLNVLNYWSLVGLAGCLMILAATLTFRWVEYPFMSQRRAASVSSTALAAA
jgi:peptidoglycan/LPS O-acetylase OafA/YrhL